MDRFRFGRYFWIRPRNRRPREAYGRNKVLRIGRSRAHNTLGRPSVFRQTACAIASGHARRMSRIDLPIR